MKQRAITVLKTLATFVLIPICAATFPIWVIVWIATDFDIRDWIFDALK